MSPETLHILAAVPIIIVLSLFYITLFWVIPRINTLSFWEGLRRSIVMHIIVAFLVWFFWGVFYLDRTTPPKSIRENISTQVVEKVEGNYENP